ncbi:MAG TPA: metalloregulator ArsR/SmtB family transcription factor [Puia sp.]|nr:metalloregulator ArsR/SmtB family transcription factor [Puia sp.]
MTTHTLDAFQVIADPSRRQILHLLSRDSMTINALAENFEMSRPAVSKHIKIMYSAGFISITDIGRERHCTLKQDGFNQLQEFINYFDKFWENKLRKLETILNNKSKLKKNEQ